MCKIIEKMSFTGVLYVNLTLGGILSEHDSYSKTSYPFVGGREAISDRPSAQKRNFRNRLQDN